MSVLELHGLQHSTSFSGLSSSFSGLSTSFSGCSTSFSGWLMFPGVESKVPEQFSKSSGPSFQPSELRLHPRLPPFALAAPATSCLSPCWLIGRVWASLLACSESTLATEFWPESWDYGSQPTCLLPSNKRPVLWISREFWAKRIS